MSSRSVDTISPHHTIIAVMGLSGTGKSTFINSATKTNSQAVGTGLSSCTSKIAAVHCLHPTTGKPFILVDTPGIDVEKRKASGQAILNDLAKWLKIESRGDERIKISGFVYLHDINAPRADESGLNNLLKSSSLCGNDITKRTVLATTMWDETAARDEVGEMREQELKSIWPKLFEKSKIAVRFDLDVDDGFTSAWKIIDGITTVTDKIGRIIPPTVLGSDTIIAVVGPTGTGKSTFVDIATSQDGANVGHSLASHTSEIRAVRHLHPKTGKPYVLIDTPGFDDTTKSDTEILEMIANWLKETYSNNIKLSGIVYLHRITDNRMAKTPLKNINMFSKLCGDKAIAHVVLTTTMWTRIPGRKHMTGRDVGEEREKELKQRYWDTMMKMGSKSTRFGDTRDSAWRIIDVAVEGEVTNPEALLLQEELVDLQQRLNETQAGRELFNSLGDLLIEQQEAIRKLNEDAKMVYDVQLARELEAGRKAVEQRIQDTLEQLNKMEIPFGRRVRKLFLFWKKPNARPISIWPSRGREGRFEEREGGLKAIRLLPTQWVNSLLS